MTGGNVGCAEFGGVRDGAGLMNWMVRMCAELEVSMNSVERMIEYMPMESEAPAIVGDSRPPDNWPHAGAIDIQNLVVRYRPELPPVIGGLSFATRAREKVGAAAPLITHNACSCIAGRAHIALPAICEQNVEGVRHRAR